jgi:hypothetical protein
MKRVKMPLRLNATLRAACEKREFAIALDAVRLAHVYSRAWRKALGVALRLAEAPFDFRTLHRFTEPDSRLEHRVVVRWAHCVQTKEELLEVLEIARGLRRSKRLERYLLRRLRPFGYQEWWERVANWWKRVFLVPARRLT